MNGLERRQDPPYPHRQRPDPFPCIYSYQFTP